MISAAGGHLHAEAALRAELASVAHAVEERDAAEAKQRAGTGIDFVPGRTEPVGFAIPRIAHFAAFLSRHDIQQHRDPGLAITRIDLRDIGHVRPVHAEDMIERMEILRV